MNLLMLWLVGFVHSSFTFGQESFISKADIKPAVIPPGMLVSLLQKGLHYTSIEFHLNDDGSEKECTKPYSLLEPHICEKTSSTASIIPRHPVPSIPKKDPLRIPSAGLSNASGVSVTTVATTTTIESVNVDGTISSGGNKKEKENSKKRKKDSDSNGSVGPSEKKSSKKNASGEIATTRKSSIQLFASEAVKLLTGHESEVITCAWNPSKEIHLLASASGDGTVRLWTVPSLGPWDLDEAKMTSRILEHIVDVSGGGESRDVTTMDWSPDGQFLATGCYDGNARLWTADGDLITVLSKHSGPIFQLQWSPDGKYLVSAGVDPSIAVWDVATRSLLRSYECHTAPALDVDWRGNDCFATCSSDRLVHVYRLDQAEPVLVLAGHQDEVNSIKWSPQGDLLVSCSDDTNAKIWKVNEELTEGSLLFDLVDHSMEIYTAKWNTVPTGDGNSYLLATASFDGTVKIWDSATGVCRNTLKRHTQPVYAIAFSHCGKYLASGSLDSDLHVWNVADGALLRSYNGKGGIFEVSWSPQGHRIAACTSDSTLCVLDFDLHPASISSAPTNDAS